MPVLVVSRDFRPAFNTSSGSTHLKGNIREKIKVTFEVEVSFKSVADKTNNGVEFTIDGNKINRNTGSFITDEFSVGDGFDFRTPSSGSSQFTGTISTVTDKQIIFTTSSGSPIDNTYTDATLFGVVQKNGLVYNFGLIENDDPEDFTSPVTKQPTSFYATDINGAGAGGEVMSPLGQELQWYPGASKSTAKVISTSGFGTPTGKYTVEHEFYIQAWFLEEYIENLEKRTIPDLFEDGSIKYIAEFEFRSSYSNPNSAVSLIDSQQLGSVGWRDQNFNGFNNDYYLESISYEDLSSNQSSGLLVGQTTRVTIVAASVSGSFTAATKVGLYFSLAPTAIKYRTGAGNFNDIWSPDEAYGLADGASFAGADRITDVDVVVNSPTQIELTAEIEIPAGLTADDLYLLDLQLEKDGVILDTSDKVMLGADYKSFDKSADIDGLLELDYFGFSAHTPTYVKDNNKTDAKLWIQDGFITELGFKLVGLADTGAADYAETLIEEIEIQIVAYNSAEDKIMTLSSFPIPLDSVVIQEVGGRQIQQIDIDTNRGFNLITGDDFNALQFKTGDLVANKLDFTGKFGLKMPWQDWMKLPGADAVFYDNSLKNNGLNLNASRYSLKEGYAIKTVAKMVLSQGGLETPYRVDSPDFVVRDFNDDGNDPPEWTATVETSSPDGSIDYEGSIATNGETLMTISWIKTTVIDSLKGLWAIHRKEPQDTNGDKVIQELSSVRPYPNSNSLVPIDPDVLNFLTLEQLNDYVIQTKCIIKPENSGGCFNIYGRLGKEVFPPIVLWNGIVYQGCVTSIYDIGMIIENAGGDPLDPSDNIRIETKKLGVLFDTAESSYGDSITAFSQTAAVGKSIVDHSTGTIENGGTLSVNKLDFANAQSPPEINALAIPLTLCIRAEEEGTFSEISEIEIPTAGCGGQTGQVYGVDIFANGNLIFVSYSGTADSAIIFQNGTDYLDSYSEGSTVPYGSKRPYSVVLDEVTGELYMSFFFVTGIYTFDESNFLTNGGTGIESSIFSTTYKYWLADAKTRTSAKKDLWGGHGTHAPRSLVRIYHNGTSWNVVDFTAEINSQLGSGTAIGGGRYYTDSNGDVWCLLASSSKCSVIKGTFTGADLNTPSDWTFTEILEAANNGDLDGNGQNWAGSWSNLGFIFAFEDLGGGANPKFYIADANNTKIKVLEHNGGTSPTVSLNWSIADTGWILTDKPNSFRPLQGNEWILFTSGDGCKIVDITTGAQTDLMESGAGYRTKY